MRSPEANASWRLFLKGRSLNPKRCGFIVWQATVRGDGRRWCNGASLQQFGQPG